MASGVGWDARRISAPSCDRIFWAGSRLGNTESVTATSGIRHPAYHALPPRHAPVVRITHWLNTLSFLGLLVSGIAILLAHPRLYWGETGGVGTPSLLDLPLPFVLVGQSGWGRYLHFLSAWVCVLTGVVYVLFGLVSGHFRQNLAPSAGDRLRWKHGGEEQLLSYNVLQKLTYLIV